MTNSSSPEEAQFDDSLPFKRYNPALKVMASLPTLPMAELATHALFLACVRHAWQLGKKELVAASISTALTAHLLPKLAAALSTKSSSFAPASAATVKFPAQSSLMLSPRQSVYEIEFTAAALYVAFLAARRHGGVQRQSRLVEACFAGLLAHLLSAPSGLNGPKFLWWTWHEDHPSVRERILGALPASQAVLELAGGFSFSLLASWLLDLTPAYTQKPAVALLAESVRAADWLPNDNKRVVESLAGGLDVLQSKLADVHPAVRIASIAALFPVVQHAVSLVAQIASLDVVGRPSARSYKMLVAALTLVAAGGASSASVKTVPVKIVDSDAGFTLASAVVGYLATQAMISVVGEPNKHVSTGTHQPYGRGTLQRKDAFGNKYLSHVSSERQPRAFSIEGEARAALELDLMAKREALDDVAKFRLAADKRVADTELALQETLAWSKQTMKQVPHLKSNEFVREMEATNSVRVARIRVHLEHRLEEVKLERKRVGQIEQTLRARIAKLEDELELGSLDPSGNVTVAASEFGPQSVWYTVRGIVPDDASENTVGVCLLCALGLTAFTRALAFGA